MKKKSSPAHANREIGKNGSYLVLTCGLKYRATGKANVLYVRIPKAEEANTPDYSKKIGGYIGL